MNTISRRQFLKTGSTYSLALGALPFLLPLIQGCKTMDAIATVGVATGTISSSQADSITKVGKAVAKSFEDITPEQEYYIGRTVGAVITNQYKVYNNKNATRYLNILGQTLAQASDAPETFGGYHFLILDSDQINAFAAPGGLIFVSRGMLRCCENEDTVAAVLAHEIGHVQHKHGLQAIKKSRVTSAVTTLAMESAKSLGGEELASLTATFEGSISDITGTLINNGYSRQFEEQADQTAVTILNRIGYSPIGLIQLLEQMKKHLKPDGIDFAKTHPAPETRIAYLKPLTKSQKPPRKVAARDNRFKTALGKV